MKYFTNEDLNYINSILQKIDVGQSIISGKIEAYNVKTTNETLNKEITEKYSGSPIQNDFQGIPINHQQQQKQQQQQQQTTGGIQQQQQERIENNNTYSSSWSHSQQMMKPKQEVYGSATSPFEFSPISPFGPLTQAKSRQTFCNLIEALNQSFPDYDFSNVRPDAFTKEPNVQMVMNHVNMTLRDVFNDRDRILLWTILSGIIDMNRCTVFSYNPNDNDPLGCGDGRTWTWNYFFMTKREKKIVLFTCHAQSKDYLDDDEMMSDSDSEEQNMKNVEYYYPYASQTSQQSYDDDEDELTFENYW